MISKDDWNTLFNNTMDSLIVPVISRWGMIGGTVTSFSGWVISAQGVAAVGLVVTIGGFIVNYAFQVRKEKREKELNELLKEESRARTKAILNGKYLA